MNMNVALIPQQTFPFQRIYESVRTTAWSPEWIDSMADPESDNLEDRLIEQIDLTLGEAKERREKVAMMIRHAEVEANRLRVAARRRTCRVCEWRARRGLSLCGAR